ncbi:tRNA threonylcarbamoyladenosine biosynthesis protein TsaB [Gammaproteobacteria bacterium]
MIQILTIDTSTDACSAALWCDNKNSHRFMVTPQKHTKFILPMIYELLAEAQVDLNQLDAIAFGAGPGSFTGIRLAASIIQGLAFVANLPVIKISCLRALAQEVFTEFGKEKVLVAQDARMQEIYWGEYQIDNAGIMQAIVPDRLVAPKHTKTISDADFTGVGNGWKIYDDILTKRCNIPLIESKIYPQAQYMAELAAADFVKGLTVSAKEALPMYLREEVAWIRGA